MIRSTISISLLVIFLFEAGGMIFGFQVRQWIHKASVAVITNAEEVPAEILTMRMSRKEFDRIKIHEREFRLNNEMYDIVWRETNGDEYVIYCFRDAAEEKMIAKFLRFLANATNENTAAASAIMNSIVIGFTLFTPEHCFTSASLTMVERCTHCDTFPLIDTIRCVDAPPPWTITVYSA